VSGYRDRSGFDPMAGGSYGPPLRPYNWVQWTGIAFMGIGILAVGAYILGRTGLLPNRFDDVFPGIMLLGIGSMLINSRRQDVPLTPEARRRNAIIIALALAVSIAVAALVIYFKGAF
jgi:hypothetical protein